MFVTLSFLMYLVGFHFFQYPFSYNSFFLLLMRQSHYYLSFEAFAILGDGLCCVGDRVASV